MATSMEKWLVNVALFDVREDYPSILTRPHGQSLRLLEMDGYAIN